MPFWYGLLAFHAEYAWLLVFAYVFPYLIAAPRKRPLFNLFPKILQNIISKITKYTPKATNSAIMLHPFSSFVVN